MSATHRDEGIRLLQKAAEAMHPGTDLAAAAELLYKAHLEATDADDKATDIAHCGICFWFSVLAFFRLGAKTNIASCKSGAPEELFLTMTLKPAEYPGGVIGDRLRSAVSPSSMMQLKRCIGAALFCFQRATELGKPGLGVLWEVALYRGTGRYPECVAAAAAARSKVNDTDRKDIDSYASTYAGYESDFNWLATAPCNSIIAPEKWVQPEILDCMNRACEFLESDEAFRSTEPVNKEKGSATATPPCHVQQQQSPKKEAAPKENSTLKIGEETAGKIKAEYNRLMEPENMTRDAQGMVSGGGNVAFQIAAAYRRLQERYRTELCKKYSITPETLDSVIKWTFTPSPSPSNATSSHAPDTDVPGNQGMVEQSRTEEGSALAAPHCCWFCKTALKEDAGLQVGMHRNVKWKFKRIPSGYKELIKQHGEEQVLKSLRAKFDQQLATQTLGDVFARTWDTVSVTVPRCVNCRTIHATVATLDNKFINVSLFTGFGIGAGIGIAFWIHLKLKGSGIMWAMGISVMVIMVLSAIIGNSMANACKKRWHRGILFENDVAAFPSIQENLASGWKLGAEPRNENEAWEWGLK